MITSPARHSSLLRIACVYQLSPSTNSRSGTGRYTTDHSHFRIVLCHHHVIVGRHGVSGRRCGRGHGWRHHVAVRAAGSHPGAEEEDDPGDGHDGDADEAEGRVGPITTEVSDHCEG